MDSEKLKPVLEALFAAADRPLSVNSIFDLFAGDIEQPGKNDIRQAIHELIEKYRHGGLELKQVASGFRLQVKPAYEARAARFPSEGGGECGPDEEMPGEGVGRGWLGAR